MARPKVSEWEPLFLDGLERYGDVAIAAQKAGVTSNAVYLRRSRVAQFKVAWDETLKIVRGKPETVLYQRAIDGDPFAIRDWQARHHPTSEHIKLEREELRQKVLAEAAQRAPRSPVEAAERWVPVWTHTPYHLDFVSDAVKSVLYRPRRLVLTLPVRHGKTTCLTWGGALWYLANRPQNHVLVAGYNSEFARAWGGRVRQSIEGSPEFGWRIKDGFGRQDMWELETGGGLRSAGLGSGVTGMGYDLIIVDDPIKSFEEAYSETYREKAWDWFTNTLQSRLQPGGSIIIIMSRWHEDDIVGRIFDPDYQTEKYDEISIPAISEGAEDDMLGRHEGVALWPEGGQTEDHLEKRRQGASRVIWSANWQGNPIPLEGNLFRKDDWRYMPAWAEKFLYVDEDDVRTELAHEVSLLVHAGRCADEKEAIALLRELVMRWQGPEVRGWDLASSEKGDYTVGVKERQTWEDGWIIISDVQRFRLRIGPRDNKIRRIAEAEEDVMQNFPNDPGAGGDAAVTYLKRDVLRGLRMTDSPEQGSKVGRAVTSSEPGRYDLSFASRQENHRVILVQGRWNKAYVDELATISEDGKSGGRHDDQLDASVRGHAWLVKRVRAEVH